jgi:glycerol-3-phosphate acyltransferase PlsY
VDLNYLFAALVGYLLGSIPFGLLLTRAFGAGDVRQIGSGSIGATNVLRTGRKGLAAATVLLDAGKGVAAVLLAQFLWPGTGGVAAVAAIVGHCFPLWLGFKGGKGFATAAGVLLALAWPVFLICAAIWAVMIALTRISSVSSLTATLASPIVAWLMGRDDLVVTFIAVAVVVFFQHRANIGRLMRGEEPRVGKR